MNENRNLFENEIHIFAAHESSEALQEGDRLYRAMREAAYKTVSDEALCSFVKSALSNLDENGLVNLLPVPPSPMPRDIRVVLIYQPSYAVAALAVYLKNKLGDDETSWMDACLVPMMEKLFANGIIGHGYEAADMMRETMLIFARAGAQQFTQRNPRYCEAFTTYLHAQIRFIQNAVDADNLKYAVGSLSGTPILGEILAAWEKKTHPVFVYGTLMRRGRAADMLRAAVYGGRALLNGYQMYDLGHFPGIVPIEGGKLIGELFFADDETLERLDSYEGEGVLYKREKVSVVIEHQSFPCEAYVYQNSIEGRTPISSWQPDENEYVWYACYGSNLDSDRFACYLQGGTCVQNGRRYPGCKNRERWLDSKVESIPGTMYFGNASSTWDGKGVAFYDPAGTGRVTMRLYKITWGQLLDVREQEGSSAAWYGNLMLLRTDRCGTPIYTLTSTDRHPRNAPCEAYLDLIRNALRKECYMSKSAAEKYLNQCLKN